MLIDVASAGASGDMFLSALLNLIGDKDALVPVAASLLIVDPKLRVHVEEHQHGDMKGFRLKVEYDESLRLTPAQLRESLTVICEEAELSKKGKLLAEKILEELFQAESRAHDESIEQLHLHELGTVDTLLDIAGVVYLLERGDLLGKVRFVSTSVAIGNGTVDTKHGTMEVPVPAVSEILVEHDVLFHNGDVEAELLTPTGAAILVNLVDTFIKSTEGFVPTREGIGFGTRDFGDHPNCLRLAVGEMIIPEPVTREEIPKKEESEPPKPVTPQIERAPTVPEKAKESVIVSEGTYIDEIAVIETTVDDTDGEMLGQIYETLLEKGLAYDVVVIPAFGKKNRPCFIVKVIAAKDQIGAVAEILLRHLGTLGIRYTTWSRIIAAREVIATRFEVDNKVYMVRVKVSRAADGSIVAIKPEADDVIAISRETGIPIRELKPRIALQAHAITE